MRESKIEGYLRTEIAKLGGWMEKHTSPGTKGPPDNLVMWPNSPGAPRRALGDAVDSMTVAELASCQWKCMIEFIETKAPNGRLSVLQERDHVRRSKMGFTVHIIWTMTQAEAYLRSRGKRC